MASAKTKEVNQTLEVAVKKAQNRKRELVKKYKEGPQEEVSGSPFYRPYFGNVMSIMINGIFISVPLDGRPHKVPKVFADEFNTRIKRIDAQNDRMGTLGTNLEEQYIGEVDITIE